MRALLSNAGKTKIRYSEPGRDKVMVSVCTYVIGREREREKGRWTDLEYLNFR